jgi:hypothetical protein
MKYFGAGLTSRLTFVRRFSNSKGFSLAELMVASGASAVICLVASFAFMMAMDVYVRMIRQYETEMELNALMYSLRSSMMTASYLHYGGLASVANNSRTTRPSANHGVGFGRIFTMNDTSPATTYTGESFLVAQFNREMHHRNPAFTNSRGSLEGVQIVYQRPDARVDRRNSGAIYIDTEWNPAGSGWVRLSPVNAPQMFTRLTNFEVDNVKVIDAQGSIKENTPSTGNVCHNLAGALSSCVNQQVVSAEFSLTMRYFISGVAGNGLEAGADAVLGDYQFCNRNRFAANAQCSILRGAKFYDIDRKMTVVFANNALQRDEYLPRRPFGNLYFFAPWVPNVAGQ